MHNSQDRSLREIAVNSSFYDFIHDNTSDYDFAGRNLEVRINEEENVADILYIDFDSKVFRLDDFVTNEYLGELKGFSDSNALRDRVESITLNHNLGWSGQYRLQDINPTETEWVEGDIYFERHLDGEEIKSLDRLSRTLLGYGMDEWGEYQTV